MRNQKPPPCPRSHRVQWPLVHIHPHVPPVHRYPLPGPKRRWQSALRHGPDTLTVQRIHTDTLSPAIINGTLLSEFINLGACPTRTTGPPASEPQVRTVTGTTQGPVRTGRLHCYLSARLGKQSRQRWVELLRPAIREVPAAMPRRLVLWCLCLLGTDG